MSIVTPPYGDLWKVCRVDVNAEPVTARQQLELFDWLASHGVDYQICSPTLVITQNAEDGRLLLHVSVFARDANGTKYIDHAANRVHTTPLVVRIDDYPAWLVQASHIQDQAQKGEKP